MDHLACTNKILSGSSCLRTQDQWIILPAHKILSGSSCLHTQQDIEWITLPAHTRYWIVRELAQVLKDGLMSTHHNLDSFFENLPVLLSKNRICLSSWAVMVTGMVGWLMTRLIWLLPLESAHNIHTLYYMLQGFFSDAVPRSGAAVRL